MSLSTITNIIKYSKTNVDQLEKLVEELQREIIELKLKNESYELTHFLIPELKEVESSKPEQEVKVLLKSKCGHKNCKDECKWGGSKVPKTLITYNTCGHKNCMEVCKWIKDKTVKI